MASTASKTDKQLVVSVPSSCLLLASTSPTSNADLYRTLAAGDQIRAFAAVTVGGFESDGQSPLFTDLKSVPAAVPPLPNAGGIRGGHPSYAAQQANTDFFFDYGYAFCLRQTEAFTKRGFGSSCIGSTCKGKVPIYSRGSDPFIWDRKRNRGGAIICPGAGGHLLCLRCLDALYAGGRPFVSSITGEAIKRDELFTKYEAFPVSKELRKVPPGLPAAEGGNQCFVQRRDLAACPCCKETKTAKRGVKRPLESGSTPKELGSAALLKELKRGTIPPTAIAPGLFLVPHLDVSDGRLLDVTLTVKGAANLPRLVKVDHLGNFICICGQRACRDHDVGLLRDTASVDGWWQSVSTERTPSFCTFDGSKTFVHEVTGAFARVLPIDREGHLGEPLSGLNAEAWSGPRLRVFVVCNGEKADGLPAVCMLAGRSTSCSRCPEQERCPHVQRVLTETEQLDTGAWGLSVRERALEVANCRVPLSVRRAARIELRASGQKMLGACNDPVCRSPDTKVSCTHGGTLESWKCLPAAALDMGHSHKPIDTVMSKGGRVVASLCERWGDEGVRRLKRGKVLLRSKACRTALTLRATVANGEQGWVALYGWSALPDHDVPSCLPDCSWAPGGVLLGSLRRSGEIRILLEQSSIPYVVCTSIPLR